MKIEIEYCVPCGYLPKAVEAQVRILEEFGNRVESVSLKTGRAGVFTFRADGETVYSKPDLFSIDAIVRSISEKLPPLEHVQAEGRELLMGKKH